MTRTKCRRVVLPGHGQRQRRKRAHCIRREVRKACSGPARAVARAADRCALTQPMRVSLAGFGPTAQQQPALVRAVWRGRQLPSGELRPPAAKPCTSTLPWHVALIRCPDTLPWQADGHRQFEPNASPCPGWVRAQVGLGPQHVPSSLRAHAAKRRSWEVLQHRTGSSAWTSDWPSVQPRPRSRRKAPRSTSGRCRRRPAGRR